MKRMPNHKLTVPCCEWMEAFASKNRSPEVPTSSGRAGIMSPEAISPIGLRPNGKSMPGIWIIGQRKRSGDLDPASR